MTDVIMPQMGESIAEGTVTKWMKNVGDRVERDEPLFEISTDKVDAEIPSPAAGVLKEIRVEAGVTVPINSVLAVIAAEAQPAAAPSRPEAPVAPPPTPPASVPPAPAPPALQSPTVPLPAPPPPPRPAPPPQPLPPVLPPHAAIPTPAPAPVPVPVPPPQAPLEAPETGRPRSEATVEELRQIRSSPVVRKIAAEHNIDIREVPGTGMQGRVTRQDILQHLEGRAVPGEAAPRPAMVVEPEPARPAPAFELPPPQAPRLPAPTIEVPESQPPRPAPAIDLPRAQPLRGAEVPPPQALEPRAPEVPTAQPRPLGPIETLEAPLGPQEEQIESPHVPAQGLIVLPEPVEAPLPESPAPSPPAPVAVPSAPPTPATFVPPFQKGERVEIVPMTPIRRKTAEHMVLSKRISAHVTTVWEVDMTRVDQLRAKYRRAYEEKSGTKLSYLPFVVKATVDALKAFPVLNASVDGESIVYRKDVHLGIAVALEWGLIVPVLRNADERNLLGIAKAVQDLAERARTKRLKVEEVQGGTFTITNPGVFGGLFGTPIISQPQVGILCVGTVEKRPVVRDDAIAIRSMAYFALTFDHRLVDGADADRFMAQLKKGLQEFDEGAVL